MAHQQTVEDRVRTAVRQRNRELAFQATVEFISGIIFTAIIYGVTFLIFWFFATILTNAWSAAFTGTQAAMVITGALLLVSFISAWLGVNPLHGIEPLTEAQERLLRNRYISGRHFGLRYVPLEHSVAGGKMMLFAGPKNMLEAIATWRHRSPASRRIVNHAAKVMQQADTGIDVEQVESMVAVELLRRVMLVKLTGLNESHVELTIKGRELMTGEGDWK